MEFSTEHQFLLSARVFLQVLQYYKPAREKTPSGHFIQFAKGAYDILLGLLGEFWTMIVLDILKILKS